MCIRDRGDRFDVGLALNSPSFRIFGKGVVAADITANNMLYHGQRIDILANDRQEKLHSVYKTPWSVASGINIDMKRGQLGIAVQYYAGLEVYDILKAKPAAFVLSLIHISEPTRLLSISYAVFC